MLLGTCWRGGSWNVASVSSELGSNMYSSGPDAPTQIATTRPALSNVIVPQSRPGPGGRPIASQLENSWGERPSGPPHQLTSVCHPSSWISDVPFGAMNWFRGVAGIPSIGFGVAGWPTNDCAGGTL